MDPLVLFFIVMSVLLIVPNVVEKMKVPGMVGLMIVGMIIGPNGFKILKEGGALEVLATIGMVYLMFIAGLEVNPKQFAKIKYKSLKFGIFTFIIPLIAGYAVGRLFNYDIIPSILIGSFYSSHTLLTFPILKKLNASCNEPVAVTIGGTIFTDIASLIVLSIIVGAWGGEFSVRNILYLLGLTFIYFIGSLYIIPKIGNLFFKLEKSFEHAEFHFVMFVLLASTLLTEFIGIHAIVGAFVAGIAISSILDRDEFMDRIFFVGDALFIPIFYIYLGITADLPSLLQSKDSILMVVLFVVGLIVAKLLAAIISSKILKYSFWEALNIWSLSIPQVAATLASATVAKSLGIIAETTYNAVVVLSIVTCILSPFITKITTVKLLEKGIYKEDCN